MQKLTYILILIILFGCSPKIKSIFEYEKKGNEFVPKRLTEFDKKGNIVLNKNLWNSRSNRITTTEYKNNRRVLEKSCDYFKKQDTCVLRSFSKFEFDKNTGIEKQTLFESDSTIRFIREIKTSKKVRIAKIYSWEFSPTKNPKRENAAILTDTTYFDNKGREIKSLHYNAKMEKPWIEIFKYHKKHYTKQTIGTARDTILKYRITDLQKMAERKKINYNFSNLENHKYEIENY